MEFQELINGFAGRLGLTGRLVDVDGFARFTAGELVLAMTEVPETKSALLFIELGPAKKAAYERLLSEMFMGRQTEGAVFSVNDGKLYLHRLEKLDDLDVDRLLVVVDRLLGRAQAEKVELDQLPEEETTTRKEEAHGPDHIICI